MQLNLTTEPNIITTKPAHYMFLERHGPFMQNAPLAWQEFKQHFNLSHYAIDDIEAGAGLSRIDQTKQGDDAFIYQAGILFKSKPKLVPDGLKLRTLAPGKYASFMLTGSYSQLPFAYPAIFEILRNKGIPMRDDFCIEKTLNNPDTTPAAELKTEILIPVE